MNSFLKELQEKNYSLIELREEQQLIFKRSDELELHNIKLESVIMHTASRMRHMLEINERKDEKGKDRGKVEGAAPTSSTKI